MSGAVLGLEVKSGLELKEMLEEAMELAANKVVAEIFDPEEEEEEEEEEEDEEDEDEESKESEESEDEESEDEALTDLEEGFVADKCVVGVV